VGLAVTRHQRSRFVEVRGRRLGAERGMSIVEALIAGGILIIVALGLIPLYTQSMQSNLEGQDSTQAANYARARAEEFYQLDFNHADLTIDSGTTKVFDEYYDQATEEWKDGTAPVGTTPLWTRTTTIRQYNINDLTTPLPDSTDPGRVHIKEIEVQVASGRILGPLGVGKQLTLRAYKAQ
jgi:type II secretory pathway pseudopilin PulG